MNKLLVGFGLVAAIAVAASTVRAESGLENCYVSGDGRCSKRTCPSIGPNGDFVVISPTN